MNLELNAKQTALVLIDLEHGIVGRDLAPRSGKDVVSRCAKLAEAVRAAGGTVVYVHVLLHETEPWPADFPMPRPPQPPPPEASDLVPDAGYRPGTDVLITKRQWDAFYATHLDQALRRKNIQTIVLAGIATNFGVESTARSAQARGYELVFAEDAMSSMGDLHSFAVEKTFRIMGRVRTAADIEAALKP